MKFIAYKLIFGDPKGAVVFERFKKAFESMKVIDPDYKGPNHYWAFYQLGESDDFIRVTLLKFEVWSSWKEENAEEPLKTGYVGNSCGIFFYFADIENTWDNAKEQINNYFSRQSKEKPVLLVISLYDSDKHTKKELLEKDYIKEQMAYIKKCGGDVLFIPDKIIDNELVSLYKGFVVYFIKKLNKQIASDFDLNKEMRPINLEEVKELLLADKIGLSKEQQEFYNAQRKARALAEEARLKKEEAERLAKEAADSVDAKKAEEDALLAAQRLEDWKEKTKSQVKEKTNTAISPEGEEITLINPTEEELVELSRKGYEFSSDLKAIIPRYCPKCGNYNQRMIKEMIDKHQILMDYPKIYGLKTVCGNCGCEWNQNTREVLKYEEWKQYD